MRRPIPTVVDDVLVGLGLVLLSIAGALWIAPPGPVPTAFANAPTGDGGWKPLIDGDPPIAWPRNAELDVAITLARVPEAQRPQLVNDIDASLEHITAASPYQLRRTYDLAIIPTEDTLADVAAAVVAENVIAVDDSKHRFESPSLGRSPPGGLTSPINTRQTRRAIGPGHR